MREVRNGLLYTESHEWVQKMGDGTVVIGITDHAQHEAGDIVYVDVPREGEEVAAGDEFGALESVKTVEPLYSPVSGKIVKSNKRLDDAPDIINTSPFDDGWLVMVKLSDPNELNEMMDASAYRSFTG
ncbi:MAG: glycine cleavage system protein GcvH [Methanomassiliicoccaceae archaeon]|jgi:glycine cleavage system H protein|nr:glycine cleavage system protein GcvH [Methanomassiliicoccaceae archaeon]